MSMIITKRQTIKEELTSALRSSLASTGIEFAVYLFKDGTVSTYEFTGNSWLQGDSVVGCVKSFDGGVENQFLGWLCSTGISDAIDGYESVITGDELSAYNAFCSAISLNPDDYYDESDYESAVADAKLNWLNDNASSARESLLDDMMEQATCEMDGGVDIDAMIDKFIDDCSESGTLIILDDEIEAHPHYTDEDTAEAIRNADCWTDCWDSVESLCRSAGLDEALKKADDRTFEDVIRYAGTKLGVDVGL